MPTRRETRGAASAAPRRSRVPRGFTLLEIIFAVVILGIMTKFAMMKLVTPATLTLRAQASSAAEQVRRAQTLAMARRQRMGVGVTTGINGQLTIGCATTPPACPADAAFVYTLGQGVVVGSPSAAIFYNSLGQPVDAAGVPNAADVTLALSYGGTTHTVSVAALTGHVSLAP